MIPDNDPRTVEEIASDAGLDPQPISLLDRISKMRSENKESTGPKPRSAKRDSMPRRPRMRSSSSEVPPFVEGYLTEHLTKFYGNIGMMVGMFDPTCGSTVVMNAKQMAESMEKLAETSPGTRKFLMSLVSTSALAEVIAAHMPVLMAIAMHHTSAGQRLSMMMPQNEPQTEPQGA
jgi:hypothetical protein